MPPQELQTRIGEATRPLEPFCVQLRPGEDPNGTVLNLPDDLGADPPSHADPYDTKLVETGSSWSSYPGENPVILGENPVLCLWYWACLKKSGHRSMRYSAVWPRSTRNFRTITLRL